MVSPDQSGMRLACIPPVLFVTLFFFLFHSQVLGLADYVQSHLAFLVFLWTRDAMIE